MAARGGLWIIDSDDEAPEPAKESHESSTPREETQAKVTVKEESLDRAEQQQPRQLEPEERAAGQGSL